MKKILKDACIFSAANCKEAFIYAYPDGKRCFADLQTVNHIANDLHKNISILYNMYRVRYTSCIRIVDMRTGEVAYYDIVDHEFFKP